MSIEIIEHYFIQNGIQLEASKIEEVNITQPSIYEVIRVVGGTPLFLEDHIKRLQHSANSLKVDIQHIVPGILSDIKALIQCNGNPEKNLKLFVYNVDKATPDYLICFIKSSYPTEAQYTQGVPTILFHAERSNPNAKIINDQLRQMTNQKIAEAKAYEALLVNNAGEITEGSRSNLFFLEKGKIYTAPARDVLIGITRQYIIQACSNLGLEVVEQPIPFSMVDYADGAFITGTSPKVLPIKSIEERELGSASNETVVRIMKEYDRILAAYVEGHR